MTSPSQSIRKNDMEHSTKRSLFREGEPSEVEQIAFCISVFAAGHQTNIVNAAHARICFACENTISGLAIAAVNPDGSDDRSSRVIEPHFQRRVSQYRHFGADFNTEQGCTALTKIHVVELKISAVFHLHLVFA